MYDSESHALGNLYSEQLAAMLGCLEVDLFDTLINRRCKNCGLWYKASWLAPELLIKLFHDRVPVHPKGWDAQSDRFSEQGWANEIDAFANAILTGNAEQIARYQRGLNSILDSILDAGIDCTVQQARTAIAHQDASQLRALLPLFSGRFSEPFPFKRFSGFSASNLWDWLVGKLGPIRNYAEIGCPLWGQLAKLSRTETKAWYYDRVESNYWSAGCQNSQIHCVQSLCAKASVRRADWNECPAVRMDVLGAFQYLDHLQDPVSFMAEAFIRARSVLLILDGVDQPPAVQHFTGWSDASIAWLGKLFGKQIVADFDAIRPSGNRAWLLKSA